MPNKINIISYESIAKEKKATLPKHIKFHHTHPSFFSKEGVRSRFHLVHAPNFPRIVEAYEKANIPAFDFTKDADAILEEKNQEALLQEAQMEALYNDDYDGLVIDSTDDKGNVKETSKPINDILNDLAQSSEDDAPTDFSKEQDATEVDDDSKSEKNDRIVNIKDVKWPYIRSLAKNFQSDVPNADVAFDVVNKAYAQGLLPDEINLDEIKNYNPDNIKFD